MQATTIAPGRVLKRADAHKLRFRRALQVAIGAALLGTVLGAATLNKDPLLGSALGAGIGFLAGSIFGAFTDWRVGLIMLVFILLGEDSLRKAVPGSPYTISLGKDVLLAACYLCFAFRPRLRNPVRRADNLEKYGVYLPILMWMAFVVLQAANPAVPHILVGISGIRTWMVYFPMMVLMSHFFRDKDSAHRFFRLLAYMAIPIFIVTFLQNSYYHSMPNFLRETAAIKARFLESGGIVRYNESIFASPTLLALVSVFHICIVIGLLKAERNTRNRVLLWISGYCAVMSAHLSGIRTGLMFCLFAVICALPLILYRFEYTAVGKRIARKGLISGGVVGLILGGILVGMMQGNRAEAFWTSISMDLVNQRMEYAIDATDMWGGGLMGHGTGSAGKSGRVMTLFGQPPAGNESVEWGTALVRYSFGEVGLILGAILGLWAFFALLRCALYHREAHFAPMRYMLWIYIGAQLSWFLFKAYPVLENGTMGVLFWSSAGLIMGLRRLDELQMAGRVAP